MPPAISRFFASFAPTFRPPFEGLWVVVLIYYTWCFLVFPHSQTLRGNLPDPDDYMYLTQILDWIGGQGWYDNIQHRMNPPTGVPIHFSRLAMLPMAVMTMIFRQFGLAPRGAATIMALIEPLILFGMFFAIVKWMAETVMSRLWSGVTAFVTLFATGMTFMFMPGHVDHHGMIIVIVAFVLGCVLRMIKQPEQARWGIYAGLGMAFGLTVALEILPWLLLIAGIIGLWAMAKGHQAARNAMAFGLVLYLASMLCLGLTRPPKGWMELDVLTYSVVYVFMTGGIALAFIGVGVTGKLPAPVRWIVGSVLAIGAGGLFLHHFPDLITGPYGGMDPELAEQILGEIDEAQPLTNIDHSIFDLLYHILGALVGLGAAAGFLRRARDNESRWLWGTMTALLAASILLTVFYQRRFTGVMGMLSIVPLAALLEYGWSWISANYHGRRKVWAEIFLVMLVGPLPSLFYPALVDNRTFATGMLMFPVDPGVTRNPCDTYVLEKILRDPKIYGDRRHLILSSMGMGPELLFRTPHGVLAAPFHMNVTGNIDSTRFFSTPYASEAEAIAHRRHADLVVACRYVPEIYLRTPESLKVDEEHGKDFAPHFIELLMTNKAPPWLKQVNFKNLDNWLIFEVAAQVSGLPKNDKVDSDKAEASENKKTIKPPAKATPAAP
jgi:hypothetical protein